MKKSSLLVTLPVLALSGLLLSGCGMFRSTKAWETAKQESPLEIPPGMDTPPATAALVIPPPGSNQPASTSTAGGQIADGFVVSDTVDNTYQKVGQAIESGSMGQLASHDDSAHSYTVNVPASAATVEKKGFFGRLFDRHKKESTNLEAGTHPVQITISASGSNASQVRAEGNAAAVAKVIDVLKSRLGG